MDKYEYKIRADEIKDLITHGEYVQAAEIADTIDWRRVKSVMMLCTISDLYKINRRYEDARDMLLLAYERRPGGRTICYSLCELSIKMEDYLQAVEYYKEFVQIAPKDSGRYILQYKLYEAQDVSLEERIEVLEELKKKDYREKWAYELAYLYHRVGLGTRCAEECDELILWFGEGKYVIKAMELKMLHQPLTPEQQAKYDRRFAPEISEEPMPEQEYNQYDQNEAAGQAYWPEDAASYGVQEDTRKLYEDVQNPYGEVPGNGTDNTGEAVPSALEDDLDIHVKTMDVGQYNTINLQAELAEGLKEILENPKTQEPAKPMAGSSEEEIEETEVFFGETEEIGNLQAEPEEMTEILLAEDEQWETEQLPMDAEQFVQEEETWWEAEGELPPEEEFPIEGEFLPEEEQFLQGDGNQEEQSEAFVKDVTGEIVMEQMRLENTAPVVQEALQAEPPGEMAKVLSQEADGQISLVVPEDEKLEKQITGQMNIEDILAEWECMKKANQAKQEEEVRQHVLQQTGSMFTEFEAAVRDGLLEKLESERPEEVPEEYTEEEVPAEEFSVEEYIPEDEIPAEEPLPVDFSDEAEAQEEAEGEEVTAQVSEESSQTDLPKEKPEVVRDKARVRNLTREEKELYAPFIQSKSSREQLVKAIDNVSMAAYAGNIIITGEEGMDTMTLAQNMVREIQMTDSNFSGKAAKISGQALNQKNVEGIVNRLKNGALIIRKASGMKPDTAAKLYKTLQREHFGIVVLMEDTKKAMDKFLKEQMQLAECFSARVDVEALSNDMLVAFGRQYAREKEYSIDELGVLALHTRIEDLQTIDHVVTVLEVREIVDEAIFHANKKTIRHFFDILFARRYDDEDMIILSENDFV